MTGFPKKSVFLRIHYSNTKYNFTEEKKQRHFAYSPNQIAHKPSFLGEWVSLVGSQDFFLHFRPILNHFLQQPNNTFSSFQSLSDRQTSEHTVGSRIFLFSYYNLSTPCFLCALFLKLLRNLRNHSKLHTPPHLPNITLIQCLQSVQSVKSVALSLVAAMLLQAFSRQVICENLRIIQKSV